MAANDHDQCIPLEEQFGGYDDAMFIDPPDQSSGLLCPVCFLVLREPHLMSCCGKHLCKMCLARVEAVDKPCPCCNGEKFFTMFDKGKNGVILGLKVYCSNRGIGCNWTGELGDMNRHIETKCEYAMADCPYGCGQCIPRHSIPNHTERECSKRPIEVQLKCLSTDMEERLRAIELKYEEKVAELEKNNTALQATVKEQERKLDEQQKEQEKAQKRKQDEHKVMYEEKIAVLEGKIKQQKDELSKSMFALKDKQKKQELETLDQIKKQAEKEEKKMADQNKRLVEMKNYLKAIEVVREGQVRDLKKQLVAHEKKLTEQGKDVLELKEHWIKTREMFSQGLQQLKEVQKVHEDRLTALKGSSDSCINELRKMENYLTQVYFQLSCEVIVSVSLGQIKYIKTFKESIFKSARIDDLSLIECLDGPNPVIKIHGSVPLHQKCQVTQLVSSINTATFQFPPEKEEVFKYLFGEEQKWKKIIENLDDKADDVMIYFIQNMQPFTVEVCGSTQEGVRRAVDELKSFRDNSPVEVGGVKIQNYLRRKMENLAASMSVSVKVEPSQSEWGLVFKHVTLKGGKYDVQLLQDYIYVMEELEKDKFFD